jgi:hypothetical protein
LRRAKIKKKKIDVNFYLNVQFRSHIRITFISPKPSPKPSDVQLLSTRHVTKVHLLQKFLDPQKHALIDNILPTCVYKGKCVSTLIKGKHDTWLSRGFNMF